MVRLTLWTRGDSVAPLTVGSLASEAEISIGVGGDHRRVNSCADPIGSNSIRAMTL
jgi:hypothetical protein